MAVAAKCRLVRESLNRWRNQIAAVSTGAAHAWMMLPSSAHVTSAHTGTHAIVREWAHMKQTGGEG